MDKVLWRVEDILGSRDIYSFYMNRCHIAMSSLNSEEGIWNWRGRRDGVGFIENVPCRREFNWRLILDLFITGQANF